jgi:hypothetical protein
MNVETSPSPLLNKEGGTANLNKVEGTTKGFPLSLLRRGPGRGLK